MAYTPTVWQAGDTVTVSKLNKIEQGIADAGSSGGSISNNDMIIPVFTKNGATYTCDMTFAEIATEVSNGKKLAGCVVAEVLNGQVSLEYFMGTISYLKDAFAQFSSTSINGVNGSFTATLSYESDNTITFERNTITIPSAQLLIVHISTVSQGHDRMDKTYAEIKNAVYNGGAVKFYKFYNSNNGFAEYTVKSFYDYNHTITLDSYYDKGVFSVTSDNDYPECTYIEEI